MAEPTETVNEAVEAVNVGNVKTIAEAAAHSMALVFEGQAAHFNRMNMLAESLMSVACKNLHELDPTQAISQVKALTGNDIASQITALTSAIASIQQMLKGAQTTPPTTA